VVETPDWAREIREKMAKGEVEGFFIYADSGREIDFMEKNHQAKKIEKKNWLQRLFGI